MTTPRRASFRAIGTDNHVLTTRPGVVGAALGIALAHLAELDPAASRFRPDSEVSRLARSAAGGPITTRLSPLLDDYLRAALRAAVLTGGLVDPTVGAALVAEGYDADLPVVRARAGFRPPATRPAVPGWRSIVRDRLTGEVTLPAGLLLDLGATSKAHAADTIAATLARSLPGGFLVNLGGDVATSGEMPEAGWRIGVDGTDQVVTAAPGQCFATSSTRRRAWRTDAGETHHVIDPRTGRAAVTPWAQVTCAGASTLEANAASTAAVVLGDAAPAWLSARGVPARLQAHDGAVARTCGWPAEAPDRTREVAA